MKLLQNKLVVGVLGVAALAIVANNFGLFKPSPKVAADVNETASQPGDNKKPKTQSKPSKTPNSSPTQKAPSGQPMDLATIQMRLPQWIKAPGRDPFQHFAKQPDYPGVGAFLKLSAVWRQTTSRLAVINQKVLAEGDMIEEYRIERIEGERVWVHGPIGLEPLELELALVESRQQRKTVKLVSKRKP